MANSICLRCLSRPLVQAEQAMVRPVVASQMPSFSTSASLSANPPKKKGAPVGLAKKGGTSYKQGRVGGSAGGKSAGGARNVGLGERKALRKRVVLSNTNALEVQGMQDFTVENLADADHVNQVLGFTNVTVDSLRANEAFKSTQGWNLFRRPATLVRKETAQMGKLVEETKKKTARKVIYGDRGSGKSVLLLQAMAMAHLKDWVVIHIPEAKDLVIGHTAYLPTTTDNDTTYIQPQYTANLLGAIGKANYTLLSTLQLSQKHDLPIPIPEGVSLARFCELGARDPDIAWDFYQALWKELSAPGRPSVMYTLDAVNHVMAPTAYLNAETENVHAHDLAIVRHFMNFLSGKEKLANGGVILAADSNSNRPGVPAFDFALERNQAIQQGREAQAWDPYVKVDRRVLDSLNDVDVWKLEGLTKDEAKGVMEYYAKSGMLRYTVNDKLVGEKWTLSGGGIIGALEKASVMLRV